MTDSSNEFDVALGGMLRQMRDDSQTETGRRLGTDQGQISRYERGVTIPDLRRMMEFARLWDKRLVLGFEEGDPGSFRLVDPNSGVNSRLRAATNLISSCIDDVEEDEDAVALVRAAHTLRRILRKSERDDTTED